MSESFLERLARGRLLLDGGMGSSLIARGVAPEATALANLEQPEQVRSVHRGFLEAGSEVVLTNTFAAHPLALEQAGSAQPSAEVLAAGAQLARESVASVGRGYVAGNLGPVGAYAPQERPLEAEALARSYGAQARVLVDAGVDCLSLETFWELDEAATAIAALRAVCALPVTACVTYERGSRGWQTPAGAPLGQALQCLAAAGADAVGLNCGTGSADLAEALSPLVGELDVPLLAKPNAGLPSTIGGVLHYDQEPEDFAADLARLARLGVQAVGGCCGTDRRFIAALATRL